jgi:thiol-disulfide isomerase/thioredoxin
MVQINSWLDFNKTLMKNILRLTAVFFAVLTVNTAFAQLEDGSIAPDFTATDLNGVEWNLYDILDEGKSVILDFSATWCGPCWSYHQQGVLEEIYNTYGPEGTDEVMVFVLEADDDTTLEDLYGTGGNTTGDWVTGTPQPIMDNTYNVFQLYTNTYYPTIYTVCPNRILVESGQASLENHVAIFQAADCQPATLPNDPAIVSYDGATASCGSVDVVVTIQNLGTDVLTSATIEVSGGVSPLSYDWTGSLNTYATAEVMVGSVELDGGGTLNIEITSADDNDTNNSTTAYIAGATEATSHLRVEINTDNWGEETGWEIMDDNGTVVASVSTGTYASETNYIEDVFVPATGCYTFRITDSYGDGLNGSIWGGIDGSAQCRSLNDDWNMVSVIYDYNGNYEFEEEEAAGNVNTTVSVEENEVVTGLNVYPNPTNDISNLTFGVAQSSDVTVTVYNMVGAQVMSQDLGTVQAGEQRMELDFSNVEAGLYIVSLNVNGNVSTVRVTLTK